MECFKLKHMAIKWWQSNGCLLIGSAIYDVGCTSSCHAASCSQAVQPVASGLWWLGVTLPWEVGATAARAGGSVATTVATGALGTGRWLALNATQSINRCA